MGSHFALALARYGADVVLCSRTRSELEKVAAEIRQLGRRALIQQMDVVKNAEIQATVDATVKEFGKIDILVKTPGSAFRVGRGCDRRGGIALRIRISRAFSSFLRRSDGS